MTLEIFYINSETFLQMPLKLFTSNDFGTVLHQIFLKLLYIKFSDFFTSNDFELFLH